MSLILLSHIQLETESRCLNVNKKARELRGPQEMADLGRLIMFQILRNHTAENPKIESITTPFKYSYIVEDSLIAAHVFNDTEDMPVMLFWLEHSQQDKVHTFILRSNFSFVRGVADYSAEKKTSLAYYNVFECNNGTDSLLFNHRSYINDIVANALNFSPSAAKVISTQGEDKKEWSYATCDHEKTYTYTHSVKDMHLIVDYSDNVISKTVVLEKYTSDPREAHRRLCKNAPIPSSKQIDNIADRNLSAFIEVLCSHVISIPGSCTLDKINKTLYKSQAIQQFVQE